MILKREEEKLPPPVHSQNRVFVSVLRFVVGSFMFGFGLRGFRQRRRIDIVQLRLALCGGSFFFVFADGCPAGEPSIPKRELLDQTQLFGFPLDGLPLDLVDETSLVDRVVEDAFDR